MTISTYANAFISQLGNFTLICSVLTIYLVYLILIHKGANIPACIMIWVVYLFSMRYYKISSAI